MDQPTDIQCHVATQEESFAVNNSLMLAGPDLSPVEWTQQLSNPCTEHLNINMCSEIDQPLPGQVRLVTNILFSVMNF